MSFRCAGNKQLSEIRVKPKIARVRLSYGKYGPVAPFQHKTHTLNETWLAGPQLEALFKTTIKPAYALHASARRVKAGLPTIARAASEGWCPRQDLNLYGVTH
jgi:hypothetical protein